MCIRDRAKAGPIRVGFCEVLAEVIGVLKVHTGHNVIALGQLYVVGQFNIINKFGFQIGITRSRIQCIADI